MLLSPRTGTRQTGIHRYIANLSAWLPLVAPNLHLVAFCARGADMPGEIRAVHSAWPVGRPAARVAWETAGLPIAARRQRLDVFHGCANALPPLLSSSAVVTIHDLALLLWPEQVPTRRYRYLRAAIGSAVGRADLVLAVSETTRRDVIERFNVADNRVRVTHLGVDPRFRPVAESEVRDLRRRMGLDRPFALYVGTLEPRKNLPALIEAFQRIAADVPHDLVLAGAKGWLTAPIGAAIKRSTLGDRLRITGFVSEADLPALYSAASALAMPSLYEGFGLPVIEAMACGTPVVTSDSSSLAEIGIGAADLVDPLDVSSIADGLRRVLADEAHAAFLVAQGTERARSFTWWATAEATMAAYQELVT